MRNRERLAQRFQLMEGDVAVQLAMLDKGRTHELARSIGVAAPRMWPVKTRAQLDVVRGEVSYPCALKPRHSHLFRERFPETKLFLVQNQAELVARFEQTGETDLEMLVTELIPGSDDRYLSYWTYLDGSGRPLFHFTKRKLRQYPIHFGVGTLNRAEWHPAVAELGLRFLQGIGFRGFGSVEFKHDPRDGQLKLIECNPRLTEPLELSVRSGMDVPWIIYSHVAGRPQLATQGFRNGARLWFPSQDLEALRDYRQAGELSLLAWLRSLLPWSHVALFRLADPGPALAWLLERVNERLGLGLRPG